MQEILYIKDFFCDIEKIKILLDINSERNQAKKTGIKLIISTEKRANALAIL
jgi:hypothetical protein